jgi:hypothetical protein
MEALRMRSTAKTLFTAAFILPLSCAVLCHADELPFKDGGILQGTITRENDKYLKLKADSGEFWVWKEDLTAKTVYDEALAEYETKIQGMNKDSAEEHSHLAQWCKERNMTDQSFRHLEEVLRLDPANEAAGATLGLKKAGGKYVLDHAARAKQGLSRYLGELMKKDDRQKHEKGEVKDGSAWVNKGENEKKLWLEKDRQLAVRLADRVNEEDKTTKEKLGPNFRTEIGARFLVRTNVPVADCAQIYRVLQDFTRQWMADFGFELGVSCADPIDVYYFDTQDDYVKGLIALGSKNAEQMRKNPAFCVIDYRKQTAKIFMYRCKLPTPEWQLDGYIHGLFHELTHYFNAMAFKYQEGVLARIGPLLYEGFASFFEGVAYDEKAQSFKWGAKNGGRLAMGRAGRDKYPLKGVLDETKTEFYKNDGLAKFGLAEMFGNYLMNYEKGKYRSGFLKLILSFSDPAETETDRCKRLEKYLGMPFDQMEKECRAYTDARKE